MANIQTTTHKGALLFCICNDASQLLCHKLQHHNASARAALPIEQADKEKEKKKKINTPASQPALTTGDSRPRRADPRA